MWHNKKRLFIGVHTILLCALLFSCIKESAESCDIGQITLTTDWSLRTEGVEIPAEYTLEIADYKTVLSGTTNHLEYPKQAGLYRFNIYNLADKITITDLIASAATSTRSATTLDPLPGWFFSWTDELILERGDKQKVRSVMIQQVRELDLALILSSGDLANIRSVESTISGIAGAWDIRNNSPHGEPWQVVIPTFIKAGNTLTTSLRILGIIPEVQQLLRTKITFTDGKTIIIDSDLTSLLADFNTNKHIKVYLNAELNATNIVANINNWAVGEDRPETVSK